MGNAGEGGTASSTYVEYDIPESALDKWADECLTCKDLGGGRQRFRFSFRGGTCTDGGTPFTTTLEIVTASGARGVVIEDALISIPEADLAAAARMCEHRRQGQDFLARLHCAPDFCGSTLEEALARRRPTNPAGCLCTSPMVSHKWRLALSTVHHVLRRCGAGPGRLAHASRELAEEALRREHAVREAESAVRLRIASMERPEDVFVLLREIGSQLRLLGVEHQDVGIQVVNQEGTDFVSMSVSGSSHWDKVLAGAWESTGHGVQYPWVLQVWRTRQSLYQPCLGSQYGDLAGRSLIDVAFSRGTLAINDLRQAAFDAAAVPLVERLAQVLSDGFQRFDDLVLRRRAAQALADSEVRYRELFEHLHNGVVVYDAVDGGADFVITEMNTAGARICRVTALQVLGRPVTEAFPDVGRMGMLGVLRRVWSTGAAEHLPAARYHDGRVAMWVENDVYRLPAGGLVAVFTDVTERQRMEQEVVQAQRLRAIGDLSAGISHNLNNILTTILGPAQLLEGWVTDPAQLSEVHEIIASARRAGELVRRLHQSVRGATEKTHPVEPNRIVANVVHLAQVRWRETIEAAGARIEVVLALQEVPAVRATVSGLQGILANLVYNAGEAMPRGGTLTVRTAQRDKMVEVVVADTGVGMSEAQQRRVFEPFFTTKADVGAGLGLSSARGSVAAWGGEILVDSAAGAGTSFTLLLPVWEEASA